MYSFLSNLLSRRSSVTKSARPRVNLRVESLEQRVVPVIGNPTQLITQWVNNNVPNAATVQTQMNVSLTNSGSRSPSLAEPPSLQNTGPSSQSSSAGWLEYLTPQSHPPSTPSSNGNTAAPSIHNQTIGVNTLMNPTVNPNHNPFWDNLGQLHPLTPTETQYMTNAGYGNVNTIGQVHSLGYGIGYSLDPGVTGSILGNYNNSIGGVQIRVPKPATPPSAIVAQATGKTAATAQTYAQATGHTPASMATAAQAMGSTAATAQTYAQATGRTPASMATAAQAMGSTAATAQTYAQATGNTAATVQTAAQATGSTAATAQTYAQATGQTSATSTTYAQATGSTSSTSNLYAQATGSTSASDNAFKMATGR